MGHRPSRAVSVLSLGYVSLHQREVRRARALFEEALSVFQGAHEQTNIAECLAGLAAVAVAEGQPERGARLFSAADALLQAAGAMLDPADVAERERSLASIRAQSDQAALDAAWAAGRVMTLEQAVAYALGRKAT
jgi:hypothetical protein